MPLELDQPLVDVKPPKNKAQRKAKQFPELSTVTKPNLLTDEFSHNVNVQQQTARVWACYGTGPIQPTRINGRLNWSTAETKRLVGVA